MAYEAGTGIPVIAGGGDMFGGGGSLGALLIGAVLGGGGIFGGFGRGAAGADLGLTAGLQNQINGLSNQIAQQGTASEINELESMVSALGISTMTGIKDNALAYVQGNGALSAQIADANFRTLQGLNAQNLTTLNSFNQLTAITQQGFNEIGRDTANSFNQVQMGLNALSAQSAACCCELKSAIHADGEATRALINSINTQNLNTTISDLKNQVNTNTIINSLRPVVVA